MFNLYIKLLKLNFIILFFSLIFHSNFAYSQTKKTPVKKNTSNDTPKKISEDEKLKLQQELDVAKNREIAKLREENEKLKNLTDDEKKALGIAVNEKIVKYNENTPLPNSNSKVIPLLLLKNWRDALANAYDTCSNKIIIINKAYAIDYNIYKEQYLEEKFEAISSDFKFDEETALVYVLPNLALYQESFKTELTLYSKILANYLNLNTKLKNYLPQTIIDDLNDEEGALRILERQKKLL